MPDFWQGVEFSHLLLSAHINKGDRVVDATCGNGFDTIFLSQMVGSKGKVYSFDIQKQAIKNTKEKLRKNDYIDRVNLIEDGHQNIDKYIKEEIKGMVFNLGYLPGTNKEITTKRNSTLSAVEKGLKLLAIGGIIVLVIYTGHPGGKEELEAILDLSINMDQVQYNVLRYNFLNQNSSPQVLAIIRRRDLCKK